jgi:hypothetical protein
MQAQKEKKIIVLGASVLRELMIKIFFLKI